MRILIAKVGENCLIKIRFIALQSGLLSSTLCICGQSFDAYPVVLFCVHGILFKLMKVAALRLGSLTLAITICAALYLRNDLLKPRVNFLLLPFLCQKFIHNIVQ